MFDDKTTNLLKKLVESVLAEDDFNKKSVADDEELKSQEPVKTATAPQQAPAQKVVQKPQPIVKKEVPSANANQSVATTPQKQVVSKPTAPAPNKLFDPISSHDKPVSTAPQQPQRPSVTPEVKAMQDAIYSMKIRMGKLGIKQSVSNFLRSLKDYDLHVTKFADNKDEVMQYLAPLKANCSALAGLLESLEAESNKLEKLINKE